MYFKFIFEFFYIFYILNKTNSQNWCQKVSSQIFDDEDTLFTLKIGTLYTVENIAGYK
jgi:hypothetical protein